MNINVLMASGEEDAWENVHDSAHSDQGSLVVLDTIEGDEIPGNIKTLDVTREIQQVDAPPMYKTETYQVLAEYAPGMWVKVEYA